MQVSGAAVFSLFQSGQHRPPARASGKGAAGNAAAAAGYLHLQLTFPAIKFQVIFACTAAGGGASRDAAAAAGVPAPADDGVLARAGGRAAARPGALLGRSQIV